ncbi:glycosyltransferase involved in cell wall biosynthesis [Hydrogenispora ethanolica]|uniref:Glycosyltransferase involved in cell wall biosynthesis n=1 Tax=Hydrogenispora ethanolica TaxID=1082276 RepID=A0A4R1RVR4_HYDET|nr:glycosyltransferase [Hydrogenispora ethanolica]TCL70748.1 glycosyltransferase involved in cell wall biosynthesis [Hydrogenispora ethanolica]
MKVGIRFEGKELGNIDFSKLEEGNPGVGGTEFLLIQLSYYLIKYCKKIDVVMYTSNLITLPEIINQVVIENDVDTLEKVKEDNIDIFIFVPKTRGSDYYKKLDQLNIRSIAWVHNYIDYRNIERLQKCSSVKRIVFVGRQHYDAYFDDYIINKAVYIYNMVVPGKIEKIDCKLKEKSVTYVGALIPTKGFHKLAKQWKAILKEVPDAKLYVIGSGKLYDRFAEMGPQNIAEKRYETKLMKYLSKNENLLDSVCFCGTMGVEKEKIIEKTKVGVANPTGISETFCLSAVEFEAVGIPVVSYKGYGLLDTISDKHTGLLIKTGKQLREAIVTLLKDNETNSLYGANGQLFYNQNFTPEIIIKEWEKLFHEVMKGDSCKIIYPNDNMMDDWKWLRILNHKLKNLFGFNKLPSLAFMVSYIKQNIKKILKR